MASEPEHPDHRLFEAVQSPVDPQMGTSSANPRGSQGMSMGVMTMAYGPPAYIRMAKGMARSIRLHNPGVQLAIVTDRSPASLRRWFDVVVPLDSDFGPGLAQKLHLDLYTPFDQTLYMDADFLVFADLQRIWDQFRDIQGFSLFGLYLAPGEAHYAIDDLPAYMAKLGMSRIVMSNTGILYFDRSPTAGQAFELAREIAQNADCLGLRRHPAGFFNDEPIFGSVVELLDLPFISTTEECDSDGTTRPIFTLASFGTADMTDIDVRRGRSRHIGFGHNLEPSAIHFNVETQKSKVYDRELRRLEFGPRLGSTQLPDVATTLAWSLRRLRQRLRGAAVLADGLPLSLYARKSNPSAAELVEEAAKRSPSPFTFVQVGSNDGRTGDPLFETVRQADVRGLLIEPMPELFERLTATYAEKRGLIFVNAAVAEDEGSREFFWVPSMPGDPIWVDQLGSFSREVVLSHSDRVAGIAERIKAVTVPCRTLSSLMTEQAFTRVDLLHIDAEGFDLAVLKTVDFRAPWAPRFILYEQKHLGPERATALALLRRQGYHTVDLGDDAFAFRGNKARLAFALQRKRRRRALPV